MSTNISRRPESAVAVLVEESCRRGRRTPMIAMAIVQLLLTVTFVVMPQS